MIRTEKPEEARLVELESLRGLAAVSVVVAHIFSAWLPVAVFGPTYPRHGSLDFLLFTSPFNAIYNGNFAVLFFFVHSGFVLSLKYVKSSFSERDLTTTTLSLRSDILRRYLRLAVPVFASVWLAFFIHRLGFTSASAFRKHEAANLTLKDMYTFESKWSRAFHESLFGALLPRGGFISAKNLLNPPLWTIAAEFFGSIVTYCILGVMFLSTPSRKVARLATYLVLLILFARSGGISTYLFAFVIGMAAADIYVSNIEAVRSRARPREELFLVTIAGFSILLGSATALSGGVLGRIVEVCGLVTPDAATIARTLGAASLLVSVLFSQTLVKILRSQFLVGVGKRCFSLYLVHTPIIYSAGIGTSGILIAQNRTYHYSAVAGAGIAICGITVVTELFYRLVDRPSMSLMKRRLFVLVS
jgi:peptidoglycan/LPS O-acetylase OafA/YrhL